MAQMRPVLPKEVDDLLTWRPLLLFNKTLLGPAFVDRIVRRSPNHITSKGGKALPLELWYSILDFSKSSECHYVLLRPLVAVVGVHGGKELVCQKFKCWNSFGTITTLANIEHCNLLLAHPDKVRKGFDNPFSSPRSREYGRPASIPVDILHSTIEILHVKLTVPDVIRYLEVGGCYSCLDERMIGRYGNGYEVANCLISEHQDFGYYFYLKMLCPVCVGVEHAVSELRRRPGTYDLSWETQTSFLSERLLELGFKVPTS
ncbi:hypothetical protein ACHAPU_003083 [Fusarium lateritium]